MTETITYKRNLILEETQFTSKYYCDHWATYNWWISLDECTNFSSGKPDEIWLNIRQGDDEWAYLVQDGKILWTEKCCFKTSTEDSIKEIAAHCEEVVPKYLKQKHFI